MTDQDSVTPKQSNKETYEFGCVAPDIPKADPTDVNNTVVNQQSLPTTVDPQIDINTGVVPPNNPLPKPKPQQPSNNNE